MSEDLQSDHTSERSCAKGESFRDVIMDMREKIASSVDAKSASEARVGLLADLDRLMEIDRHHAEFVSAVGRVLRRMLNDVVCVGATGEMLANAMSSVGECPFSDKDTQDLECLARTIQDLSRSK